MRNAAFLRAVNDDRRGLFTQPRQEEFPHLEDRAVISFHGADGPCQRGGHAHGQWDGFGARARAVLLMAAPKKRAQLGWVFHDEGADAFGPVKLVSTDGQGGDA